MKIEVVSLYIGVVSHERIHKEYLWRGKPKTKTVVKRLDTPYLSLHCIIRVHMILKLGAVYTDEQMTYTCTSVSDFSSPISELVNTHTISPFWSIPTKLTLIDLPINEVK